MELILDASSPASRVALATRGTLQWESSALAPQEHTRELLPAVLQGMQLTAVSFTDLEAIVVALGPGPFNGLRVAVSTAKGIAQGTGAAIVGIPTLEAEVARCKPDAMRIRPVVRAGRANFTTALFEWSGRHWRCVEAARHMNVPELAQLATGNVLLCGEVNEFRTALAALEPAAVVSAAAQLSTRTEALARLGWERLQSGDTVAVAALQPLYVNPPHITIPRDRRP